MVSVHPASLAVHLAALAGSSRRVPLAVSGGARVSHILRETARQLAHLLIGLWHVPVIGHWIIYILGFIVLSLFVLRRNTRLVLFAGSSLA